MTTEDKTSLIIQVLSNQKTASEAAQQMGVSRKTYYKWENRALSALRASMEEHPGGRPRQSVDPEKAALLKEKERLQARVQELEQVLRVKDVLLEEVWPLGDEAKKKAPSPDQTHEHLGRRTSNEGNLLPPALPAGGGDVVFESAPMAESTVAGRAAVVSPGAGEKSAVGD